MQERITIFCDAATEPVNPGGYGCCAFIAYPGEVSGREGAKRPDPLYEKYGCVGKGAGITNNVCEYRAVVGALKWAVKYAPGVDVEVRTDSQLVVQQVTGAWACNADHLRGYRDEAKELMRAHGKISLRWIPRDENWVADYLTRVCYSETIRREREEKGLEARRI
jgi:ribonuclease HI